MTRHQCIAADLQSSQSGFDVVEVFCEHSLDVHSLGHTTVTVVHSRAKKCIRVSEISTEEGRSRQISLVFM